MRSLGRNHREVEVNGSASAQLAAHGGVAAGLFDKPSDASEAQSLSSARRGHRHAAAGVRDRQTNVLAAQEVVYEAIIRSKADALSFDDEPAAPWHGIAGTNDEVEDSILELTLVDANGSQPYG